MSETYESILSRMQDRFQELAGFPADDASDIGIRLPSKGESSGKAPSVLRERWNFPGRPPCCTM